MSVFERDNKTGVFPQGHIDRSGWEAVRLGDILSVEKGTQLGRAEMSSNGTFPVFNGGTTASGFADDWNTENAIIISEGGNSCGFVNFVSSRFWRGGHCYKVESSLPSGFLYQFLKYYEPRIMALRVGSGLPNIQKSALYKFEVSVPSSTDEQHRIAEALNAVDKRLDSLSALLEKQEAIKKSTLSLLMKPKESLRHIRICDICNVTRGRVISQKEIERHPGPYPVYSSQTSDNGRLGSISTYDYDGEYLSWTTDGANAGTTFYRNGRFNCTNVCGLAIPKEKELVSVRFLVLAVGLVSKQYVSYIGNPKLMSNVFKKVEIALPPVEEQYQIASAVATIDDSIATLTTEKEKTKLLKQGLMRYFFG